MILTGAGGAFSAGYDIGNLTPERLADVLIHPFEAALAALDDVAVPVVAASTATPSAAGWSWRLACDLRVCAPGAKLGMPPARLGVVYSHTGLAALRRRHRDRPHARAVPDGAEPVDAETAQTWGLVNEWIDE